MTHHHIEPYEIEETLSGMVENPERPGVYILELTPINSTDELKSSCVGTYPEVPKHVWAAFYAHEVYYVGATGNMKKRLRQHVSYDERGADMTEVFGVFRVVDALEFGSRDAAMANEKVVAKKFGESRNDDVFVYQS